MIDTKMIDVKEGLFNTVVKLNFIIIRLIEFIEVTCSYDPISKEYQMKWLELIDKELANGNTNSAFWKEKYRKF